MMAKAFVVHSSFEQTKETHVVFLAYLFPQCYTVPTYQIHLFHHLSGTSICHLLSRQNLYLADRTKRIYLDSIYHESLV